MALPSRAARLVPVVEMAEEAERKAVQRLGHFQQQVELGELLAGSLSGGGTAIEVALALEVAADAAELGVGGGHARLALVVVGRLEREVGGELVA